uniref:Major facilitator superfamily (MFS) profile domain-containing protein n=1 Tax=Panagrolaimus sp. JU765 TaxID=591449 RepID=A0AC34QKJ1_9BILA
MFRRWGTNFFLSRFDSLENVVGDQRKLIVLILLSTTLSILPVGYHIIVLNVPAETIQNAINQTLLREEGYLPSKGLMDFLWAFIVACQSIGALFGCLLLPPIQRSFGTKKALMLVNNGILLFSSFLLFMSFYVNTLFFLIAGRIMVGIYTGLGSALLPIFIQELAPKNIKGTLSCFVHIGVCAGSALGALLSITWILGGPSTWHLLLAIPAICGIIQIGTNYYIPDVPNYYLQRNDKARAAQAIKYYYSFEDFDDDVAIMEYKQLVTKTPNQVSFKEAFMDQKTREGIFLGMVVSASQIFSGSMAAVSYSTSMFTAVSFISFLIPFVPTLGALFSILLTLPALRFVETCGRKELLINTMTLCAIANWLMLIFSLLAEKMPDSYASIGFAMTFLLLGLGYNLGTGPVSYFIPGELVPPNASGIALGCGVAINWLCTMITNLIYYPLIEYTGGFSYLLFALPTTMSIILLYYKLPDNMINSKKSGELILTCNLSDYFENDDETYGTFETSSASSPQSSRPSTISRHI